MWLVTLIIIGICILLDAYKRSKTIKTFGKVPLTSKLPFLGTVLQTIKFTPENTHLKFQEYVRTYGKNFYSIFIGRVVFLTSDTHVTGKILSSQQPLRKNVLYEMLSGWLGQGLLLAHGSHWQTMRRIITPSFHYMILEQFVTVFDRQSRTLVKTLKEFADGETVVDIYPHMGLATLDIIAETAMGVCINAQEQSNSKFVQVVNEATEVVALRFIRPLYFFNILFKIFAPQMYKSHVEGVKSMHAFTESIIQEGRKRFEQSMSSDLLDEANLEKTLKKKKMALLDILLSSQVDGKPLTDRVIRDEVNTFMFEGHDTTTSATSFCLYLISRHAEVQKKLYLEIKERVGENLETPLTCNDLNTLNYLHCVVKESLRLYPPIPAIGRWLEEDFKIDDITFPAGTNIIMLLWTILRDPDNFEDPDTFKPERHSSEKSSENAFSFIPFSAGPRNCIGQRFALLEMKAIVVQILRNFELLPLGKEVEPSIKIVLRSTTGVQFGIKLRN